jgi:hypothetical protein
MRTLALFSTIALLTLGFGVSEAQLPAHLLHATRNQNSAGDCLAIASLTPSVGVVAGDSLVPCAPSIITTAYTNSTTSYTPILSLPPAQASATLRGECTLTYAVSNTAGTATFAIGASAAPTDLWVTSTPSLGAFSAPTFTTITSTATTAVTGALTTATANAPYQVQLTFTLVNAANPTTLTVYAESSNSAYAVSVEPGSSCAWLP